MMRWARYGAAGMLIGVGVLGLVIGGPVALAQSRYARLRSRYSGDIEAEAAQAERAHARYPHNYRLAMLISQRAWNDRATEAGAERPGHLALAREWGERGRAANPYREELRLMHLRFLRREDPQEAVRFWEAHVQWQFWSRYNHFLLLQLYADAGNIAGALEELAWVEGSTYEREARRIIELAFQQDRVRH
jgi:hypothetical protein